MKHRTEKHAANLPIHSRQIATLEIEQYQSQKPRLTPWLFRVG
jgi:hypothetical protein